MSDLKKQKITSVQNNKYPDDWNFDDFGIHLDIFAGRGFKKSEYTEQGIKLLRIDNVSYGKITWESIAYLPKNYLDKYSKLVLDLGDILLALNRPITNGKLKIAILEKIDVPSILYQRVGKITFKNKTLDKKFIFYVLKKHVKKFVEETSVGSDQPFISTVKLKKLKLPIPNNTLEQNEIGETLYDLDELIRKLEILIEKKNNIKQGLMHELLTGKKRLHGFNKDWKPKKFSELFATIPNKKFQIQTSEYRKFDQYPIIDQGKQKIVGYSNKKEKIFKCPEKGIIVFGDHTRVLKFVNFDFIVGADGTQIIVTLDNNLPKFFYYQFQTKKIPNTGYNRHFKFLKEFCFLKPELNEQIAITDILSDIDLEIKELETQMQKYMLIQEGMTQKLLTGEIRLK